MMNVHRRLSVVKGQSRLCVRSREVRTVVVLFCDIERLLLCESIAGGVEKDGVVYSTGFIAALTGALHPRLFIPSSVELRTMATSSRILQRA